MFVTGQNIFISQSSTKGILKNILVGWEKRRTLSCSLAYWLSDVFHVYRRDWNVEVRRLMELPCILQCWRKNMHRTWFWMDLDECLCSHSYARPTGSLGRKLWSNAEMVNDGSLSAVCCRGRIEKRAYSTIATRLGCETRFFGDFVLVYRMWLESALHANPKRYRLLYCCSY